VHNDTFFHAIHLVLNQNENVHFVCPGMAGERQAQQWVEELRISSWVDLLPAQSQHEMADLFRDSRISLSITTHDGTPNTLLEAMACGCFPIAGDIESLREWIIPGVNGLLVDPMNPQALATAILEIIAQPDLQSQACERNLHLVKERAEYGASMHTAEDFYMQLIG
jgi:glycosyltransferase involved in cell wall biosynthesis